MRIVYKGNYIRMTCGEIGLVHNVMLYFLFIDGHNKPTDTEYMIAHFYIFKTNNIDA